MGIELVAERKCNSKRPHPGPYPGPLAYLQRQLRERIETTISSLTQDFPKRIHATTQNGFYLKLTLFILAYMVEIPEL